MERRSRRWSLVPRPKLTTWRPRTRHHACPRGSTPPDVIHHNCTGPVQKFSLHATRAFESLVSISLCTLRCTISFPSSAHCSELHSTHVTIVLSTRLASPLGMVLTIWQASMVATVTGILDADETQRAAGHPAHSRKLSTIQLCHRFNQSRIPGLLSTC